ncbi:MAG: hypothetical protein NTX61_09300 [Bacteroidetes bacterium]|nr:hypothetical protein [Bacteroidota bacterium]
MKLRFLLFLFALIPFFVTGQTDSLENKYRNFETTKSEIISKWRRILLDKFMEGDIISVKEIKTHLVNEVGNEDYAVFHPSEYWLLLYWTQEYDKLITNIKEYDSTGLVSFQKKIKPQKDYLYAEVRNKTKKSISMFDLYIRLSGLKTIDKEFLSMNLKNLLAGNDFPVITQDSLNILADNFLLNYPKSSYENYIRKYTRLKYVPAKWGLDFEIFSGYGIFTGNLQKSFKDNVPIGIAVDIYYKNFVLFLRDYIGFSKVRTDIPYDNGTWKRNAQVRVYLPEASFGYVVLNIKHLKIAPFAGIGSTDIGPTQNDVTKESGLKKVELKFTTTYTMGLTLDLKLGNSKKSKAKYIPEQSFFFVRVRYAYTLPQFDWKYNGFNGNMHYITIGFGSFSRKIKRDL